METKRGHHHTSTCYFWPVLCSTAFHFLGNFFVTPFLKTKKIFTEEIIVLLFQQKSHARLAPHFMLLFWRLENSIWSTTYFLRFCNFLNEKSWKSIISVLWALKRSEIFEGFLYVYIVPTITLWGINAWIKLTSAKFRLFLCGIHPSPCKENAGQGSFGVLKTSFSILKTSFSFLKTSFTIIWEQISSFLEGCPWFKF